MLILALNCGSSSLKFALVDPSDGVHRLRGAALDVGQDRPAQLAWQTEGDERSRELGSVDHAAALGLVVDLLRAHTALWPEIAAVGHRVVHGGERFSAPRVLDEEVVAHIEALCELAPLHNPLGLLGIRELRRALPRVPHVAVFDTAFHQTLPPRAFHYALPRRLHREHGVRRYGFHGTSHRHAARETARRLDLGSAPGRIVTAHLGNGCSIAAVKDGRSVDTSMGLSPLEGLVMGTRSGDVDPGLHEYLARRLGLDLAAITDLLNRESGLLGLSGTSSDMRVLLDLAAAGDDDAALAVEVFCYRLAKAVAACTVPLAGLDAVVFTGGIGENAAPVRARVVELLAPLGLRLDPDRNRIHGRDSGGVVTGDDRPCALVVACDEELLIALDAAQALQARA